MSTGPSQAEHASYRAMPGLCQAKKLGYRLYEHLYPPTTNISVDDGFKISVASHGHSMLRTSHTMIRFFTEQISSLSRQLFAIFSVGQSIRDNLLLNRILTLLIPVSRIYTPGTRFFCCNSSGSWPMPNSKDQFLVKKIKTNFKVGK
jgi:hypothetical protein